MRTTLRPATGMASLALLAIPAIAQDYYESIFGGGNSLSDAPFSGAIGGAPQTVDTEFDDDDNMFSTQLIAAMNYAISDTVSLFGDVRYIVDCDLKTERFNPAGGSTGFVSEDLETTAINVGLCWRF